MVNHVFAWGSGYGRVERDVAMTWSCDARDDVVVEEDGSVR